MRKSRPRSLSLWTFVLALLVTAATAATAGAQAPAAGKVLMLGSSVMDGPDSVEAQQATAQGFGVDVVDDATWSSMTTAQFAAYRAIVIGDNNDSGDPADIAAAEDNAAVWGAAVTGNIMVSGADAEYHAIGGAEGATKYIDRSIAFAAAVPGHTGAYVSLGGYYGASCGGDSVEDKILDAFSPGGFTSQSCHNDAIHIDPAVVPGPGGLTDADMSDWGTTTHNAFTSWPASFRVWAIGLDESAQQELRASAVPPPGEPPTVTTSDGPTGYARFLVSERSAPVASAGTPGCTGAVSFTNTDNAGGSGSKAVHYAIDGGAAQAVATSGNPGAASLTVTEGNHTVEYWGEDQLGNVEATRHTLAAQRDTAAPTVAITSDQRRATYTQGDRATITTAAGDATSGLAQDPSRARQQVSTAKVGRHTVTKAADDKCGNRATATFRYTVRKAPKPRVAVLGARAAGGGGCARSSFALTIRTRAAGLRSVRVTLDGRTIKRSSSARFRVRIPAGALRGGGHTVRVVAVGAGGRSTRSIAFVRCGATDPRFTG
jgi:hypothetical protein